MVRLIYMYNGPLEKITICKSVDIGQARGRDRPWGKYWGWAHNIEHRLYTKMTQSERERKVRLSKIRGKVLLTLIRLQEGY